ncbi:MAG: MFS transporter [Nitrospirota bacterium]
MATQGDFSPLRTLGLLSSAGFLAWMSYEMIRSPVLALYAGSLGVGPAEIGFIVAASTITGIFVKFPAGALSDHLPRKRILLFGMAVFGFTPFVYLLAANEIVLTVVRFFHGLATAVTSPVVLAVIADMFREKRAEAMSWYSSIQMTGGLLGPVIGGAIVYSAGFSPAFLCAGAAGSLALVLVVLRLDLPPRPASPSAAGDPLWPKLVAGLREVAGDRNVLVTSAAQAAQFLATGAIQAFLPLYALSVGLNSAHVGVLFGVQLAVTVLSKPILGRFSDRMGRRPFIAGGLLVTASSLAAIPWFSSIELLLAVLAVFGIGVAAVTSSVPALVADFCRERHYGSAMGVFGTVMDVGHASGPIAAGLLVASAGYRTAFLALAVVLVLSSAAFFVVVREGKRAV